MKEVPSATPTNFSPFPLTPSKRGLHYQNTGKQETEVKAADRSTNENKETGVGQMQPIV